MFLDEIADKLSLSGATPFSFSISNFSGKAVLIQGSTKIINYSTVKILFNLGKQKYSILGENLKIKNLTADSILVQGEIFAIINESKFQPK